MENASKALIMAGGMLLAILLISLLIYAWGIFSKYQSSQDSLAEIEDTAKFNEQFTNYDRDDVMGYEIISLCNNVADYDNRYSLLEYANNDKNYDPITITVNMTNDRTALTYSGDDNILFTKDEYIQSDTKNQLEKIILEALDIEKLYGDSTEASKVAKNLTSLTIDYYTSNNKYNEVQAKNIIIQEFKKLTKIDVSSYDEVRKYIGDNSEKLYKYYEYYQFKKAIFECNQITYNNVSGRVSEIEFDWTGKIK